MAEDLHGFPIILRPEDFHSHIRIGRGKDSIIYAAQCAKLGGQVAVKVYDKARTSASKLRAIKREAAMMVYLSKKSVPAITSYYGAFQDSKHIYIVMEYCARGDLLERLLNEGRAFSEARVCDVAAAMLAVLQRMHALGIIHRDVKLENIFIGAGEELKLGDFGLTMSMKQELAISPVGTVEYMAPEVVALPPVDMVSKGLIDPHSIAACNEKVDIWALGITLYELLTGHLPFDGDSKEEIKRAITLGRMRALPSRLSPECASFICSMLECDPEARPGAAALLQHPFVLRNRAWSPRSVLPAVADATAYITGFDSPAVAAPKDGSKQRAEARLESRDGPQGQGSRQPSGSSAAPSPRHSSSGAHTQQPSTPERQPSASYAVASPHQQHRKRALQQADQQRAGGTPQGTGHRSDAYSSGTAAPPPTPQPAQGSGHMSRMASHSSFSSVSFYNAEADTPLNAAVAGELIRARHWQGDGASPGIVGCTSPAPGSVSPAKGAPMLRVKSRDILAPYSPLASKSVRGGLQVELGPSVDEDNMLSWRHGDRRPDLTDEQQVWSPTRLLQKSFWSTFFRSAPPVQPAH